MARKLQGPSLSLFLTMLFVEEFRPIVSHSLDFLDFIFLIVLCPLYFLQTGSWIQSLILIQGLMLLTDYKRSSVLSSGGMQRLVIFYDACSHWCLTLLTQCRYKMGGISFTFQLLAGILLYRRDANLILICHLVIQWSSVYRKDRINASFSLPVFKMIIKHHYEFIG